MNAIVAGGLEGTLKSPQEHNAFDILALLPVAELNKLKTMMGLDMPGTLGRTTLDKFIALCGESQLDLSANGVSQFKESHGLGNSGALQGVIGAQTAQVYYDEIIRRSMPAPTSGHRTTNAAGIALIKEFEGLAKQLPDGRIAAYADAIGVPTIGYGHTHGVHLGMIISRDEAENLLRQDLATFESGVEKLVKVSISDNEFAALVAFSFNLGLGNLGSSTLLAKLNAGKPKTEVAAEFLKWTRAGGHVLQGLVRRRQAEQRLFLS